MHAPAAYLQSDGRDQQDRVLIQLARRGDVAARNELVEGMAPAIGRIAGSTRRKYQWIEEEDLQQEMFIQALRYVDIFNLGQSTNPWKKYCTLRLHLYAKQWLRERDPLGIGWPHRKMYPAWTHLSQTERSTGNDDDGGDHAWIGSVESDAEVTTEASFAEDIVAEVMLEVTLPAPSALVMWLMEMTEDEICEADPDLLPMIVRETLEVGKPIAMRILARGTKMMEGQADG